MLTSLTNDEINCIAKVNSGSSFYNFLRENSNFLTRFAQKTRHIVQPPCDGPQKCNKELLAPLAADQLAWHDFMRLDIG